jgi:hypothetical protein
MFDVEGHDHTMYAKESAFWIPSTGYGAAKERAANNEMSPKNVSFMVKRF